MGSGAKSYMRNGFLIYEEMRNTYFIIYDEALSHIWLCTWSIWISLYMRTIFIIFFISVYYTFFGWLIAHGSSARARGLANSVGFQMPDNWWVGPGRTIRNHYGAVGTTAPSSFCHVYVLHKQRQSQDYVCNYCRRLKEGFILIGRQRH
jgi:hypothetical protein